MAFPEPSPSMSRQKRRKRRRQHVMSSAYKMAPSPGHIDRPAMRVCVDMYSSHTSIHTYTQPDSHSPTRCSNPRSTAHQSSAHDEGHPAASLPPGEKCARAPSVPGGHARAPCWKNTLTTFETKERRVAMDLRVMIPTTTSARRARGDVGPRVTQDRSGRQIKREIHGVKSKRR